MKCLLPVSNMQELRQGGPINDIYDYLVVPEDDRFVFDSKIANGIYHLCDENQYEMIYLYALYNIHNGHSYVSVKANNFSKIEEAPTLYVYIINVLVAFSGEHIVEFGPMGDDYLLIDEFAPKTRNSLSSLFTSFNNRTIIRVLDSELNKYNIKLQAHQGEVRLLNSAGYAYHYISYKRPNLLKDYILSTATLTYRYKVATQRSVEYNPNILNSYLNFHIPEDADDFIDTFYAMQAIDNLKPDKQEEDD